MAATGSAKQNLIVACVMAVVLIWGICASIIVPAGEFPPRFYQMMEIGLDLAMTVILLILVVSLRSVEGGGLKVAAMLLGTVGVAAGVGKLAIRLTSDHAWWTGNYLPPVFN